MSSVRKSVTKAGVTRWQAVWSETGQEGPRRRTRNFDSKALAMEHAARMAIEIENKGIGDPAKHNLERLITRWLSFLEERGNHAPTTREAYGAHLARARKLIGHVALRDLTAAHLDNLYSELLNHGGVAKKAKADGSRDPQPLAARSVWHVHRVMNNMLNQARKWGLIAENPARDATAPKPAKTPPKAFTSDEVARLLDAAGNRENLVVLSTLLVTGIRRSELLGLAMDAIDLDAGTLHIKRVVVAVKNAPLLRDTPKSASSARTISVPPALVALLREQKAKVLETALAWGKGYRREPMFLFCRPDGEMLCPMTVTIRLSEIMRRAGIKGRQPTHGWRHTCATLMLDGGINLKTASARLGHADAAFTLRTYVHAVDARDVTAGEHLAALLKP